MNTSPASGASVPDPWVGRRLGKYDIHERLGQGGMGVVYRAHDPLLSRDVALKVLSPALPAQVQMRQRFLREARLAIGLSHPNVVTVLDVDHRDETYYLVMEYVSGGSAQDALRSRGPLAWPAATWVAACVCRGLVAAHATGLIHRDVKPANILLARDAQVKLADFGLAKAAELSVVSQPGDGVIGTPDFMSPEQCRAEEADEGSDVYSLGATYYALLTGKPPFPLGVPVQVMFAHCSRPVPDPRAADPAIPEACSRLLRRAMAKRRDNRYPDAASMLCDLEAILALNGPAPLAIDLPIVTKAAPATADTTAVLPLPRRWAGRRLALAAAVALLALVGAAVTLKGGKPPPPDVPPPADILAIAEQVLRDRDIAQGRAALDGLLAHLEQKSDARAGALVDQLRALLLFQGVEPESGRLLPAGGKVGAVAWSPDHRWLAAGVASANGGVVVWDGASPEPRFTLWAKGRQPLFVHSLTFGPDGTLVAGCGGGMVRWWRPTDNREGVLAVGAKPDLVDCVAVCPRGSLLAAATNSRDGTAIAVRDIATGKVVYRLPASIGRVYSLAFAPAGPEILVTGGMDGVVRLWERDTGRRRRDLTTGFSSTVSMAFGPSGKTLAVTGYSRAGNVIRCGVQFWDMVTEKRLEPEVLETPLIRMVCFHPSGQLLASGAASQAALWDIDRRGLLATLGEASVTQSASQAFSPGGGLLAVASSTEAVAVFDVRRHAEGRDP